MTEPSINPNSTPSGPLYARQSAQDPQVGTARGEGGPKSAQAGAHGLGRVGLVALPRVLADMSRAQQAVRQGVDGITRTLKPPEAPMSDLGSLTPDERKLLPLAVALQIRSAQPLRGHRQLLYPLPGCHLCDGVVHGVRYTTEPYRREVILEPCGDRFAVSDHAAQVLNDYAHGIASDIENSPAGTVKPGWAGLIRSFNEAAAPAMGAAVDREFPPPSTTNLREQYAAAIREAACPGGCGATEEECSRQRIQPEAWHRGVLADVSGTPEQFADAVLAVRDTRVEELNAELERMKVLVAASSEDGNAVRMAGQYADRAIANGQRAEQAEHRLNLAHQARRAKEHQLDGIRRALCDTGAMHDDDPYSHADLEDVIRQVAAGGDDAEAAVERVRALATTARVATWQACTCDGRPACGCPTRPVAWKLNPADILDALDQPQEQP